MNSLIAKLNEFQTKYDIRLDKEKREKQLNVLFMDLAKYLMYGGYFHCSKRYDLYITSVEFYYHEENGEIKDPIMYHRNKKKWIKNKKKGQNDENIEYIKDFFEIGTLNPHISGVDISFENDDLELKYRASALIRAFVVKGKGVKEPKEDGRSTYVYDYLFDGLSVDKSNNQLEWKPIEDPNIPIEQLPQAVRKNVYEYVSEEIARRDNIDVEKMKYYDSEYYKTDKLCDRMWRYSRLDSIFKDKI
jgi:hypothetical protein